MQNAATAPQYVSRKATNLPAENRHPLVLASDAVAHILAGRSADGTAPIPFRIPFANTPETRVAAATLLGTILANLNGSLPPEAVTPLAAKLLAHLSKTGLQSPDAIAAFPACTLADAIREAPEILSTNAGIAAILRGHERRHQQATAYLRRNLADQIPPRSIVWERGEYRLEEATDPRHLQHDSAVLKHCVGTSHDIITLSLAGLSKTDPDAIHHLRYWQKIKSGATRILTLTRNAMPMATIEYSTHLRAILQISCRQNIAVTHTNPIFPHLCAALAAIKNAYRLTAIHDLPPTPDNAILTAAGTFELATEGNIPSAIAGSLTIISGAQEAACRAALASPLLTVVLTKAPQGLLDGITSASATITSAAAALKLPALQQSGHIHQSPNAKTLLLPVLKTSENISTSAIEADIPALQTCRNLVFLAAKSLHFPALQRCEYIYAPVVTTLKLPALQTYGKIYAPVATSTLPPERPAKSENVHASAERT